MHINMDLLLGHAMPNTLDEMEWIKLKALGGSLYLQVDQKDIFPLNDLTSGPVSLLIAIFSSMNTDGCSK